MKNSLLRTRRATSLCLVLILSACSGLPTKYLPFGSEKTPARSLVPVDATEFRCSGGKHFYVRHLDGGNAVWLILPDRELRLEKTATGTRYGNGIAVLDVNGSEATLADGAANAYAACKAVAPGTK